MSSYISIHANRIDDGSLYYHHLKNYEKYKNFIAIDARIENNTLRFHSSGSGYELELDKWTIEMYPII